MTVRYQIAFSEASREQLRALPKTVRARIGHRITQLQDDLSGDVKKLAARENAYRPAGWILPHTLPIGGECHRGVCCERQEECV
jgi:hypothetical protein